MPGSRLLAAFAAAVMLSGPAAGAWRVAESAHFRVYAEMPAAELRQRVELLEDYRNLLGAFTTAKVDEDAPRLDIYIVDRIGQAVPFGQASETTAGFYLAGDAGIAAFATKGEFGQKVLLHEYAHHHMFAATGQTYPAWYVEGFAEYFMTATFQPTRVDFGLVDRGRAYSLGDAWAPWEAIIARDSAARSAVPGYQFYAQSWLLTHYLFRTPGMADRLGAHLKAIAAGADPLTAFKAHIEPDLRRLNGTLRGYVRSRNFTFSRLTREARPAAAVTVEELPASADDLLLYRAWLDARGGVARDPKAALAKVQAAAARFPGDDLATRTLAMAELYLGDPAKATALLEGLLAKAPDDAELLRLQATALLRQDATANRSVARRALVKAARLAPTDWRALHVYVHTHDIEHQPADRNLFEVVQLMWSLAPQVNGIVIDMASVLVQAGRMAEAARRLEPVAFAPHGGPFSAFARRLRDAAVAGDKAAYVALLDRPQGDGPNAPAADPSGNKPAPISRQIP